MSKLKTFFRTFWKSISSLTYYHDVVKTKFSFSLKYFLLLSFFIGLGAAILFSFVVIPPLDKFLSRAATRIHTLYPENLIVTIKNGQLETNAQEPLHFPIPYELFTDTPPAISDQKQQYLLTIDTKATLDDYKKSQSVILINKDVIVVPDDANGYRVYPLKETQNFILNKSSYENILNHILPLTKFVIPSFVLLLILVFIIILPLFQLVSLLFLALVLLAFSKAINVSLSFQKIYQIGLHSLTLPTLIKIAALAFGFNPPISFFNSILFLLYNFAILAELRKKPITTNTAK